MSQSAAGHPELTIFFDLPNGTYAIHVSYVPSDTLSELLACLRSKGVRYELEARQVIERYPEDKEAV